MWTVLVHPEAVGELVKDADRLRELRPRAGRSPWRAFYRQIGEIIFVVGAVGPEAGVKPRDFTRAVRTAEARLDKIEQDGEEQ